MRRAWPIPFRRTRCASFPAPTTTFVARMRVRLWSPGMLRSMLPLMMSSKAAPSGMPAPTEKLVETIVDWLSIGSRAGRTARLDRPFKSIGMPRFIQLEGVKNCRDLGGYPTVDGRIVRPRRLFRSGEYANASLRARSRANSNDVSGASLLHDCRLSMMTEKDFATLQQLGVHTVVDLRSQPEVALRGVGLLAYARRANWSTSVA